MKNGAAAPHSISRAILQAEAKAEAAAPLRVITIENTAPVDLRKITLKEAAEHLRVIEAHTEEDLHGTNVVMIPEGQKDHRLFENAESRRQSRMLG